MSWRISLENSVLALRFAADEYRNALRLAQSGSWAVEITRTQFVQGEVVLRGGHSFNPHTDAQAVIADRYGQLVLTLEPSYEWVALRYAYGATWAAAEVIDGRTPDRAQVLYEAEGKPALGSRPEIAHHLDRWSGLPEFDAARLALTTCEAHRAYADEIGQSEDLADHEATEMHRAYARARDLADAARAYGLQAEKALLFALNVLRPARQPS
jgi:hypothetical protein